jgi:hypothetical protein
LLDRPRPEGRRYSEVEVEQFEVGAIKVDVGSESSWCYAIATICTTTALGTATASRKVDKRLLTIGLKYSDKHEQG